MREIVHNKDNLKDEDVTEVVKRVKVLIVNSKKEILLGYSYHEYQFPGGHVEDKERLISAVNRELLEETGMKLELKIRPFAKMTNYYKDYPIKGNNRKNEIYYYSIDSDRKINLNRTDYTDEEIDGDFVLEYVPLDEVEKILVDNAKKYGDKKGISNEMIEILKIYKEDN